MICRYRSVRESVPACLIAYPRRGTAVTAIPDADLPDTDLPDQVRPTFRDDRQRIRRRSSVGLRLALPLLELGPERIDVRWIDDLGGNDDQLVGRDEGLVAFEEFGHVLHALV